jgi:hypothetical protein
MHKEWLNNRISVEEAEKKFMEQDDRIGPDPVPFGYYNEPWEKLKANLQDGDELWQFSSPKESWINMCGRAGLCIVRDGEIVDHFVIAMN